MRNCLSFARQDTQRKHDMGWLTDLTSSKLMFKAACGCHKGIRRENNEDNFLFGGRFLSIEDQEIPKIWTLEGRLEDSFFAVFDGMGGGDYGEVASNAAAAVAKAFLDGPGNIHPYDITLSLEKLCLKMNEAVYKKGYNLGSYQMGTTVVSMFFHKEYAWLCNLGDSRGYVLDRGQMAQISLDHNDEAKMRANGITGRKPYLTQYLGIDPGEMSIEPHISSRKVIKGTRFLLCSDGLTDMVSEKEMKEILFDEANDLRECVSKLIDAANSGGGKDNITIILIDILGRR